MKRGSKRIIITSERVNSYYFRVLTDGIDLAQYDNNPVMLWMHIRAFDGKILPIGNVIELRREIDAELGKIITGLPVFDETDDFAMRVYDKYENGTVRMASAGLRPVEWSEDIGLTLPGQRGATLVKSILEEISLVDIGSNDDAVQVALYDDNKNLITLSLNGDNPSIPLINKNNIIENQMKKIELTAAKVAVLLGMQETASPEEFETKIIETVQLAQRQKTQIETLTREKQELETKVQDSEKAALAEKTNVLLSSAETERKILPSDRSFYADQIKTQADYDRVKLHLDSKGGTPTVQSVLAATKGDVSLYAGKTWDELDKSDMLIRLKSDDLNLFKKLFKDKFGKEYKG